ncbi:MAG: hypothetical protein M1833_004415 [Piccolia ochrophora]|nr:MAG: hypothetical protein M1833_004415 [Piccolia ochrophora]
MHARHIVRSFHRGLYYPHIDFHVGDLSAWIHAQRARRPPGPFLNYVLLDLPSAHNHLASVGDVLHPDGVLAVFNPSITQIGDCVRMVKEKQLPFVIESVRELGTSVGTGGREWDVRTTKVRERSVLPPQMARSGCQERSKPGDVSLHGFVNDGVSNEEDEGAATAEVGAPTSTTSPSDDWGTAVSNESADIQELVCRPKVGARVVGGGFLGLWRKMRAR